MTNNKQLLSGFGLFAMGFVSGAATTAVVVDAPEAEAASVEVVDCDETSTSASTPDLPSDPTRPPSYCEAFPERCGIEAECPPVVVDETGKQTGGCFPVEFVCCSPGLGCWAVHFATDCDGGLYWSDCNAGEQAIDPLTGEAIIICHD